MRSVKRTGKVETVVSTETQARVFGALSDPVRLRFMQTLMATDEATGTAVAESLGISLALLCHHAKILVDAGVIEKRKEGQTSYYRAAPAVLASTFSALMPMASTKGKTRSLPNR